MEKFPTMLCELLMTDESCNNHMNDRAAKAPTYECNLL